MPANSRWNLIRGLKGSMRWTRMFTDLHVYANFSLAGASAKLRKALLASSCLSVCQFVYVENSAPTGRILIKFRVGNIYLFIYLLFIYLLGIFIKMCRENCRLVTIEEN